MVSTSLCRRRVVVVVGSQERMRKARAYEALICVIDDLTFLIGRACPSETFSIRQRLVIAEYFPRSQTSAGSPARSRAGRYRRLHR